MLRQTQTLVLSQYCKSRQERRVPQMVVLQVWYEAERRVYMQRELRGGGRCRGQRTNLGGGIGKLRQEKRYNIQFKERGR